MVHQLKAEELSDLLEAMERNTAWAASLIINQLSAGIVVEIVAGGRGTTTANRRGVVPFIFL